jgi:hypothetical protein
MRQGLSIGADFEVISKRMWQLLCNCFAQQPCCLIRSFERIGLGMRTQVEYFY